MNLLPPRQATATVFVFVARAWLTPKDELLHLLVASFGNMWTDFQTMGLLSAQFRPRASYRHFRFALVLSCNILITAEGLRRCPSAHPPVVIREVERSERQQRQQTRKYFNDIGRL